MISVKKGAKTPFSTVGTKTKKSKLPQTTKNESQNIKKFSWFELTLENLEKIVGVVWCRFRVENAIFDDFVGISVKTRGVAPSEIRDFAPISEIETTETNSTESSRKFFVASLKIEKHPTKFLA